MVKKLLRFLAYTLLFIFALIVFIPKSSIYYLLEENMKKFDIVISKETLEESIFSLKVQDMEISAKAIESGVVDEAEITLLFFYNSIHFSGIKLSSLVEAYLPSKVESLDISYSVFNPLKVSINGSGEFGQMSGVLNLNERDINITLEPSNIMLKRYKKSMIMLKKSKDGAYTYAKSF